MTIREIKSVGVIGAGAWGTAIASVAASAKLDTVLWAYEPEVVADINDNHGNKTFLPGVPLNEDIKATNNFDFIAEVDALFMVTPAQLLRVVSKNIAQYVSNKLPVIICSKGIERDSAKLMSEVLSETLPQANAFILSGPSFAADVARSRPTAVTIAADNLDDAKVIANAIATPFFRPYLSNDIIGVQLGGAIKNVLAIACGIVEGKQLGESAKAALITRGFAELSDFAMKMGAHEETLMGLSGIGDLILTCSSSQSRNMSLGIELGKGSTIAEIMAKRKSVSEGVHTANVLVEKAEKMGLDVPIYKAISDIVSDKITIDDAIAYLLSRPIREE